MALSPIRETFLPSIIIFDSLPSPKPLKPALRRSIAFRKSPTLRRKVSSADITSNLTASPPVSSDNRSKVTLEAIEPTFLQFDVTMTYDKGKEDECRVARIGEWQELYPAEVDLKVFWPDNVDWKTLLEDVTRDWDIPPKLRRWQVIGHRGTKDLNRRKGEEPWFCENPEQVGGAVLSTYLSGYSEATVIVHLVD